jgi:6,7-dimethyl-8-ribityllumazine synthase
MTYEAYSANTDGHGLAVAIVQSRFNLSICEQLRASCIQTLIKLGVEEEDILLITVPGALEIPQALQKLAQSAQFDALIALGAVVRGETYHFEVVANETSTRIATLANEYDIPIANGVLTTDTEDQAQARASEKGQSCAQVAVEMANLFNALASLEMANEDFVVTEEE